MRFPAPALLRGDRPGCLRAAKGTWGETRFLYFSGSSEGTGPDLTQWNQPFEGPSRRQACLRPFVVVFLERFLPDPCDRLGVAARRRRGDGNPEGRQGEVPWPLSGVVSRYVNESNVAMKADLTPSGVG